MVIRLTPNPRATRQSALDLPRSRGRAIATRTTAEVTSRSQTMAVGGIRLNRSFAMAAPTWTDTIPATTSHTDGTCLGAGRAVRESSGVTGPTLDTARGPTEPETPLCKGRE